MLEYLLTKDTSMILSDLLISKILTDLLMSLDILPVYSGGELPHAE